MEDISKRRIFPSRIVIFFANESPLLSSITITLPALTGWLTDDAMTDDIGNIDATGCRGTGSSITNETQ